MKRYRHTFLVGGLVVLVAAGCASSGSGGGGADAMNAADGSADGSNAADSMSTNAELAADLRYLREEEKLARDVYLQLADVWKQPIHANIAGSEQSHTDAVKALLVARGIADPVVDDTRGVFVDVTLAKLYQDLVAQGSTSLLDALIVGATIEDLDIRDIAAMQARTNAADVLAVYASLACGSRNHMRSFSGQISAKGGSYDAQFIDAAAYQAILAGSSESCGGTEGNGGRGGKGKGGG